MSYEEDLKRLEELEETASRQILVRDVYVSSEADKTGHIWEGWHDDDTGVFEFLMDAPIRTEEQNGTIRYAFSDGVALIQHSGFLETEQEHMTDHKNSF